jgi:hypothetical protein
LIFINKLSNEKSFLILAVSFAMFACTKPVDTKPAVNDSILIDTVELEVAEIPADSVDSVL